jgi:aminomethyltransferase
VARTGYTGEDGFEVMLDGDVAPALWNALAATAGVTACGLGARDTLRTEAAMPLYGHEIDEGTNPYEAGLGWAVGLGKAAFAGREALAAIKAAGPTRKLVALLVGAGGVPRPDFPILHQGQPVGRVTSGTFSPTLKRNIALGYAPVDLAGPGMALDVEARGKSVSAEIVDPPFVPHRSRPRVRRTSPRS